VKKLLLILFPLALFAQVEIDTIIRLPMGLRQGAYLQDLNKLYMNSRAEDQLLVLDCSTYQLKAQIRAEHSGLIWYSYNWRRQKLYVTFGVRPESTLVIDAAGDSVLRWLDVYRESRVGVYLSDLDVRFKPAGETLYEYECDADTIIRRWPIHCTYASWDSADHELYVGQGSYAKLYVYDYLADSCLKVIDVGAINTRMSDACVFSYKYHRGYVSHWHVDLGAQEVGIIDTQRDTLVRVLPVNAEYGLFSHVAVDERDGKAYISDRYDTMWVVDCATDSVLKKLSCTYGREMGVCIRWVPWSNRIYVISYQGTEGYLSIIDCNTDSVIKINMYLGRCQDIQLDPVRERIFLVGAPDTNSITVLRDTGYEAVAEPEPAVSRLRTGLQVQPTWDGFDLSYSIPTPCRVDLHVYDLAGREIRQLVTGDQSAGEHRVLWNCRDSAGNSVPRGVYLVRLDMPGFRSVKKAVVAR
jgi:hypothetical protein